MTTLEFPLYSLVTVVSLSPYSFFRYPSIEATFKLIPRSDYLAILCWFGSRSLLYILHNFQVQRFHVQSTIGVTIIKRKVTVGVPESIYNSLIHINRS